MTDITKHTIVTHILEKPVATKLDLSPTSLEGIYVWYCKLSQLLGDAKLMGLGGESTTAMFPNQCNSNCITNAYRCLHRQVCISPFVKDFSFSSRWRTFQKPTTGKIERTTDLGVPRPYWYIYNSTPNLKLRDYQKKRQKDFKNQHTRRFTGR